MLFGCMQLLTRVWMTHIDNVLGREKVAEQVVEFEGRLKIVQELCKSSTLFPCSSDGVRNILTFRQDVMFGTRFWMRV